MNRVEKEKFTDNLKKELTQSKLVIFIENKGLSSSKADILRRSLRNSNARLKVLKNNLARLVVKDGAFGDQAKGLMDSVVGPTMIACTNDDIVTLAKTMKEFVKDHAALVIQDSLMGTQRIGAHEVEALANLPSREVLLSQVLSLINAPARQLVGLIQAVPRDVVGVIAAIKDKKSE